MNQMDPINHDEALKTAVQLAEKTQRIRTMGDSVGVIVGKSSIAQSVMNVRKHAAQLVFGLQGGAAPDDVLENIKALQGSLLGIQVYGIITEAELESYMVMTDTIYNEVTKR